MSPKCSYIATLRFRADPLHSSHMQLWMSDCSFAPCSRYPPKWFAALFGCYMAGITWNCCHLSTTSVYTIQPCTSLQCHFIQSHIHKMHVYLAVTCHCTFWRIKIRIFYALLQKHGVGMDIEIRVSTEIWPWRRKFSCHSWLEPKTFRSRVGHSTTELSQLPTLPAMQQIKMIS